MPRETRFPAAWKPHASTASRFIPSPTTPRRSARPRAPRNLGRLIREILHQSRELPVSRLPPRLKTCACTTTAAFPPLAPLQFLSQHPTQTKTASAQRKPLPRSSCSSRLPPSRPLVYPYTTLSPSSNPLSP